MEAVYTPSYDGVPLDIISHDTDLALRVAQHVPTTGRGAQLDDRGRGARTDNLVIKLSGDDADQLEYRGWLQSLARQRQGAPLRPSLRWQLAGSGCRPSPSGPRAARSSSR